MAKSPAGSGTFAGNDTLLTMLPADISAGLFAQASSIKLAAGQLLFTAGDPGDGCYGIEEGLLKVHVISSSGGDRILAILGPGAIVGELSMLDGAPRSASVTAIREAKLSFVGRAAFNSAVSKHPELYRHMATLLARRLRDIDDALTATSFLRLKGRAARALLSLADAFGKDVGAGRIVIRHKVSQSDLAAMAGIARENFSRILQDWMRRKIVTRLAGYYCLEKRAELVRERDH